MSEDRLRELWAAFVSGEVLSEADQRFLLDALRADASMRAELLNDVEFDGMVRALAGRGKEAESVGQAFLQALEAERGATRFIKKVETRVEEERIPAQGPPRPRNPEATQRRSTRRWVRTARSGGNRNFVYPALLAAGVLFGLVLLFGLASSGPPPSGPGSAEAARRERAKVEAARRAAEHEAAARKAEEERAGAQEARKEAEKRLAKLREDEKRVEEARRAAEAGQEKELREKAEAAFADVLRKRREEEERVARLRDAEKRAEEAKQALARTAPDPLPQGKPVDTARPQRGTEAAVAKVERVEGVGHLVTSAGKVAAKGGEDLLADEGLETVGGQAVVAYPDKTRLEIGTDTELKEFKAEGGKRVFVARGRVSAEVTRQPKGQEMVIATPHGEAKVLGTTLRVMVNPDPKVGTTVEVTEGRIQFRNLAGKMVDVPAGHSAVAAVGAELVARTGVAPSVLREGLLGHWRFDETSGALAIDSSGRGHDGRIVGATRSPSRIRGGLKFDGQSSHIACGPEPSFKGVGSFSICAWVRTVSPADQVFFLQTATALRGGQYALGVFGGKVQWATLDGNGGFKLLSDQIVNDARWHHVLALRDKDGTGRIFVDGKPSGVSAAVPPSDMSGGNIYIGAEQCCTKWYFNGILDDVRLYDRALSAEEIATLAAAPE